MPARGKPDRRRAARLTRALRTRWWPRFLLVGLLLVVIGATLVGGVAATWVMGAGAAIIFIVAFGCSRCRQLTTGVSRRCRPGLVLPDRSSDVRGLEVHQPCRVTEIVEPKRPQARHER